MFKKIGNESGQPKMYHDLGHVCLRKWDRWTGQDNRAEKDDDPP